MGPHFLWGAGCGNHQMTCYSSIEQVKLKPWQFRLCLPLINTSFTSFFSTCNRLKMWDLWLHDDTHVHHLISHLSDFSYTVQRTGQWVLTDANTLVTNFWTRIQTISTMPPSDQVPHPPTTLQRQLWFQFLPPQIGFAYSRSSHKRNHTECLFLNF